MFTCEMAGCEDMIACKVRLKNGDVLECCEEHGDFWRGLINVDWVANF